MPSLYLNRLSHEEYKVLVDKLLGTQNDNCFICGKKIDRDLHMDHIDVDHVEPIKSGGKDGPDNFAITHDSCNRKKQASDLRVARVLARFDAIAQSVELQNRAPNLGDVLVEYGGSKFDLKVTIDATKLRTGFVDLDSTDLIDVPIFEDSISRFRYTFLNLPIEYLHHDDHINPRAIGKNLRKLVEEFHRGLPQLHVTLGWIDTTLGNQVKVQVFDGQHKAAAQILLGVRCLPVRVFIDPDTDTLLTANTHAGTTLRQVAFDKSVQRSLGSSLLADRMNRYRREIGIAEDDDRFSERDLVNHFKGESREMKRYVIDWVRNSITTHSDNKLRDYIDYGGRGTEMPLSYSTVERTFYSFFIYGDVLTTPFNDRLEEGANPRTLEIEQVVRLMNIIADTIYVGKYDHTRGTRRIESSIQKGADIPEPHLRAFRMSKEEIIYNWLRYLRHIVYHHFTMMGSPFEKRRLFQYSIPEACWENAERFVDALYQLPLWINKDLSLSVFGGKRNTDYWQRVFETGSGPDGVEVMSSGINYMDMIKK